MSRFGRCALALVVVALALTPAPFAQSRQDNDKAAADAVKAKGLPLVTTRTLSFTTPQWWSRSSRTRR